MKGIKFKLLCMLLSVSILGMVIVAGINIYSFRNQLLQDVVQENSLKVNAEAVKVNGWLSEYIKIADIVSKSFGTASLSDIDKVKLLEQITKSDKYLFDVYAGYSNDMFLDGSGWAPPSDYKATTRDWYKLAMSTGKASYTQPYLDAELQKFVVTAAQPIVNEKGEKLGVIGVDILLDSMTEMINNIKISKGGSAFMLDAEGNFLAHSDGKIRGTNLKQNNDFVEIGKDILSKDTGNIRFEQNGQQKIAFIESVKNTGWKLVITLPYEEITDSTNSIIFKAVFIILIASICIGTVIYFIAGNIATPIKKLYELTVHLAKGDLTGELNVTANFRRNDEIGKLMEQLNHTTLNFEQIVKNIKNSSKVVASAASEISAGNEDLSSRTQKQAASVEETTSAIEELTATVKQNADNAQNANLLSSQVMNMVTEGDKILKETMNSMEDATNSSKKINEIINVVNEIAFQTNLLALNAAVEAARAGEQGKGFAVVASEVRNLAHRSGEAAKEIQTLIKDSVGKIENSNEMVVKTGEQLSKVSESIRNMSTLISEIAAASKEQSLGIEEVNKAILMMDQMTQQNAALVQQSTATSDTMKNEAQELLAFVSQFKVND